MEVTSALFWFMKVRAASTVCAIVSFYLESTCSSCFSSSIRARSDSEAISLSQFTNETNLRFRIIGVVNDTGGNDEGDVAFDTLASRKLW